MKKVVITGAPHTGKTTLLDALRSSSPELYFVPEPAAEIIEEQHQKVAEDPSYKGIFPWNNYPEFGKLLVARSLKHTAEIPEDTPVAVFDRCLIDNNAYALIHNSEFLIAYNAPYIEAARYTVALVCDFVGTYTKTHIRQESFEVAQQIQTGIVSAYEAVGLPLVHLLPVSVEERVELVQEVIGDL